MGRFRDAGGLHGFILTGGTYTVVDFPDAFQTRVWGINDDGDIVGDFNEAPGMFFQSFARHKGDFFAMDVPCAVGSTLRDINSNGGIAGSLRDERDTFWAFEVSNTKKEMKKEKKEK